MKKNYKRESRKTIFDSNLTHPYLAILTRYGQYIVAGGKTKNQAWERCLHDAKYINFKNWYISYSKVPV